MIFAATSVQEKADSPKAAAGGSQGRLPFT